MKEQDPVYKKPISNLNEVFPVRKSLGLLITKKEQIQEIVELPLIKACEEFWDKNIRTYDSSANSKDIEAGHCYIRLDFDSLSEENKRIAEQYGEPYEDVKIRLIQLNFPVTENETVESLATKVVVIADTFEKQAPLWIHPMTLEETINNFEDSHGKEYPDSVQKEKERLLQPGAWEAECKRQGKYFDSKTETAWESEEYFRKFDEYFEIQREY